MYCNKCGKELTGNFCTNCGNSVNTEQNNSQIQHSQQYNTAEQKLNVMAITGFVVGCTSILLNFWGIVGIIALIFSVIGLLQVNNEKGNKKSKGFAIAGIIIGGFSVLYGFITIILLLS